jgi:DNA-binding Xre family transcriptional regulator
VKPDIRKYFWSLNEKALKETENILKNPGHSRFIERLVTFLSRCDTPKELFALISQDEFIKVWPKAKNYWRRIMPKSDFRDWWQSIYEELAHRQLKPAIPRGQLAAGFSKLGQIIRECRVKNSYTQQELSLKSGIKQPDISKIEEGKKNITVGTLLNLCKALGIKKIEF